jgi:hypothetical protein
MERGEVVMYSQRGFVKQREAVILRPLGLRPRCHFNAYQIQTLDDGRKRVVSCVSLDARRAKGPTDGE